MAVLFMRSATFLRLQDNNRLVVEGGDPLRVFCDRGKNGVNNLLCRAFVFGLHDLLYALASKTVALLIASVNKAIAEEHADIARRGRQPEFFVFGVMEKSQRQAGGLNHLNFAVMAKNRSWQA